MHSSLVIEETERSVAFTPQAGDGRSLVYDRDSRAFQVRPASGGASSGAPLCLGILGCITLHSGDQLVYVDGRKKVGRLQARFDVWRITSIKIRALGGGGDGTAAAGLSAAQALDDAKYKAMLALVLGSGSFYYSDAADLSSSMQRQHEQREANAGRHLWSRVQRKFVWNSHIASTLLGKCAEADREHAQVFVLPAIHGCPNQYAKVLDIRRINVNNQWIEYCLLSRQSCLRAGTRFNARGIDLQGNVANFAETEQIVTLPSGAVCAHVQVRGSIPLFWTQRANIKYKPALAMENRPEQDALLKRHFEELLSTYGDVLVFNLIDKKGHELLVGQRFSEKVSALQDSRIIYEHFDFHKECSKMQWQNVERLLERFAPQLEKQSFLELDAGGNASAQQSSVVRTNCIDCLDRTNVVQSRIARRVLTAQLQRAGILQPTQRVENVVELNHAFNNIWADNADAISFQYSGTGALKTDFTRTGKRSRAGVLQDGINSAIRYVKNNFMDGFKQDSLNLLLGIYAIDPAVADSPFAQSKTLRYKIVSSVLGFAVMMTVLSLLIITFESAFTQLFVTGLWGAIAYLCFQVMVANSVDFVDSPRLVQKLANTLN